MIKSVICLSLILLPFLVVVSVVEAASGGWEPIKDVTDPDVVATAKFAVAEYNTQSKQNLVYDQVVEGKKQVVAGVKYDLIILANNGESKKYEAVVWKKPSGVGSLISFKAV